MNVEVVGGSMAQQAADAIAVSLPQGVTEPSGVVAEVDAALGGQIGELLRGGDFKGKLAETLVLYSRGTVAAPRVIVVGLGKAAKVGADEVRRAAAAAATTAHKLGVAHLATMVHGAGAGGPKPAGAAQAIVEGTALGLYTFTAHKSKPDEDEPQRAVETLTLVEADESRLPPVRAGAAVGEAVAAGVALSRDLANHPANTATPSYLAEQARLLAERHGMRCEVWDRERIVAEGMGALASVAAGSQEPPRFIVLEHAPVGTADAPPYVLAGKGVTFDSGGISLKPGRGMGAMKYDMSGAAAVLGAMEVVGRLTVPRHVYGLIGATENLPSGTATKPGDVVRALNGTTIEVLNTDAEGRLVLADVLSYAARLEPAAVVDVATLTGAIVVALGRHAAGLFSNDDDLAAALTAAGERTGERLWRLPTWEVYGEALKSDTADIKNVLERQPAPGGSIFGAKFLERFTAYPWAHLDIAAVAWDVEGVPYVPKKSATGFGVRLLVDWLRSRP